MKMTDTDHMLLHMRHHHMTRLDWYLVGERCVVIVCAGIALLYAMGVIR